MFIPVYGISLLPLHFPWLVLLFIACLTVWEGALEIHALESKKEVREIFSNAICRKFLPFRIPRAGEFCVCVCVCVCVFPEAHIPGTYDVRAFQMGNVIERIKAFPLHTFATPLVY